MIKEKAYAKINLTLNILNKRNDGYHNLKSVMIPISLYDELVFEANNTYIINSEIEDNIITKVFNIMKNKYNISNVKITLEKNIPTQAGLAGGSADATATIRGLNKLFNLNLSIQEQEEIANMVGSDTLFTLHNKPAIISSRGDEIEFINHNYKFNILLIKPNIGISTKEAFANIKEYNLKHNDEIINETNTNKINELCYNSFLDSLLENKQFKSFYDDVNQHHKPHLTGSGSTLYIINDDINYLKEIQNKLNNYYTQIVNIK
ncbi:MAG: 4-(cytidine 5'-diphospho)-2-C-methyl-D-erythritol kinase [bacterium]